MILKSVQFSKATINKDIMIVSSFLLFIPVLGGKHNCLHAIIKAQIGKSTLIILLIKGKMPTLAENKHLSVHFFLHGPRLFHPSREKVPVRSVGNGHKNAYSRADTINNNKNKR